MDSAKNLEARDSVLAWASYADSVDKVNFVKSLLSTMGLEELSAIKRLLGHATPKTENRKRQWVGISFPDYKRARYGAEGQRAESTSAELHPVPKLAPTPQPWWKKWPKQSFIALDVEKVPSIVRDKTTNKVISHVSKAGKIAVANSTYEIIRKEDIFHSPGSFNTHPKTVAINGIKKYDLENGKKLTDVQELLKIDFGNKVIITVAGQNDFESLEMEEIKICDCSFDLQQFYRRPHPEDPLDDQPMSLRDMYFFHFKEDVQYKEPHDCSDDAIATMAVFLKGYIPMKLKGDPSARGNVEKYEFAHVPNLKNMAKIGKFYCKTIDDFMKDCDCDYCKRYKKK